MWHKWIPTKKEIENQIDQKLHKFATQENRTLHLSEEQWLQRYLYTKEHEVFLSSFLCELYEWLAKLVDGQPTWKLDNPIVWTLELVKCMKESENKAAKAVNYWINSILGGFIIEFVIDTSVSYSKEKCQFFKGIRGKYLKSLKTQIKILLCEKRVMPLN